MSSPFDELLLPRSLRDGPPAVASDAAKWLNGASARDILDKLIRDDPLGIEPRCALRLHERAILIGRERVVMRAMAQVAYRAKDYRAWQPLDAFVRVNIDRAIDGLIERDREDERARLPHEDDEAWGFLTRALGVGADQARRAAVAFNDLPPVVRRAFWRTVVEGASEARCAAEGLGTVTQIHKRVTRAVQTLSFGRDPGGDDPHDLHDGGASRG